VFTKWHGILGLVLVAGMAAGCATAAGPGRLANKPVPPSITPRAVVAAEEELAETLGTAVDDIHYLAFHKVEWPDRCLGMGEVEPACERQPTLGWWVVLTTGGRQFRFRTDLNGDMVRREE
jgi:hypothetical protein